MSAESVGDRAAGNFAAHLMEHVSERTAKEYLWLLKSSWDWAKGKYHVSDENPWTEPLLRVRIQPRQKVKPFTAGEVRAILGAFRISSYYSHYADFVVFLLSVGCRIGEAVGLQWKHVADDYQTVWIGESISDGVRRSTKTGKARTIPIGEAVGQMLRDRRKRLQPKPDDLVFPAPSGAYQPQ